MCRVKYIGVIMLVLAVLVGGFLLLRKYIIISQEQDKEMQAPEMHMNLGTIPVSREEVSHAFIWSNSSTLPVRVLKSTSSCGCTKLQISPEVIKPGESARISMTVDLRDRFGKQRFEGRIVTDNPIYPHILARLDLVIPDPIKASPTVIEFDQLSPGQEYVGWIDIEGPKGGIKIQLINSPPANIQVTVESENFSETSSEVRLNVKIRGIPQPKQEAFVLKIEATAPGIRAKRRFKIPIYGRYSGILRVNPHVLSLRAQKGASSTLIIETDGPEEPIVMVSESSSVVLEMGEPTRTGKGWRRNVRVYYQANPNKAKPKRTGQLEVRAGAISTRVPVVFR